MLTELIILFFITNYHVPLIDASEMDNVGIIEILLDAGASIETKDRKKTA